MDGELALLGGAAGFGALVGGLAWALARYSRRRTAAAFRAWAVHHGWSYVERDDRLVNWFTGTPFGHGAQRRATHVLRGRRRGRDVVMFDYSYRVSSTSMGADGQLTSTTKAPHYTVVAVATPAARPWLQVTRQTAGRRLLGRLGGRELELENEEFNRAFRLQTGSDRFAYDILHPRMMAWLLDEPVRRETPFRFEGAHLLTWETGRIDVTRAVAFADYLTAVLDQVPPYVWADPR